MAAPLAQGCGESSDGDTSSYSTQGEYYNVFGTVGTLAVSADFNNSEVVANFNNLCDAVGDFLSELENTLSTAVSTSSVSRFNSAAAGTEIQIDELTYNVLSEAIYMYEFTDGYYNPAVYYSVDLFGFTPRFNTYTYTAELSTRMPYDRLTDDGQKVSAYGEPDEQYVSIFRELATHMNEVRVEERDGKYYAYKPDYTVTGPNGDTYTMALDLGGIGKGYAADIVNVMMEEYGFEYGYFTLGSSSYYVKQSATSDDGTWSMGLTDPDNSLNSLFGGTYARVNISSVALSSSGDYEKSYRGEAGLTYCHIIDPFTGRPKTIGIAGCTVVGGTAARDDALTTALMVMGEQRAVQYINEHLKDYDIVMIVRGEDGPCERVITNVENLEYNPSYTLANTIDGEGNIVLG
ncbi:MAG TPA: FAD:protein FMN transferase [Candidatus Coproplasma excrementipullorum]|nr:FAD:protein FMN transferase [Candidatus Coproplasma excrementipullorum]